MYKCKSGKDHAKYEWCHLEFSQVEQEILARYLLTYILIGSDSKIATAAFDLLQSLRNWVTNWYPVNISFNCPISNDLLEDGKLLLKRCLNCCIPHSSSWCSAAECPSCCAEDFMGLLSKGIDLK